MKIFLFQLIYASLFLSLGYGSAKLLYEDKNPGCKISGMVKHKDGSYEVLCTNSERMRKFP